MNGLGINYNTRIHIGLKWKWKLQMIELNCTSKTEQQAALHLTQTILVLTILKLIYPASV